MSFYFLIVLCSFFLSALIVLIERNFLKLEDINLSARQASHEIPTSRLGGIVIVICSTAFSLFLSGFSGWELFLIVLPLFLIGFLEDIGFKNSPRIRLVVAGVCSTLVIYVYDAWLSNIDTLGLDWFLSFPIVGIFFTIFAIVGLINAINIIDGVNGLACGQVIISTLSISILATRVGEINISNLGLVIALSTLVFF
jgi:UDP-N-acetylmuramyl pentapeptide phosphotransferase/UDP-N-acetylglucosamine-1-phosphate transferase